MTSAKPVIWILGAALAIFLVGYMQMIWINQHEREIRHLLGPKGEGLLQDAQIVAWQPDLNYKPQAYYVVRSADEAGFRRLALQGNLPVIPSPEALEGVWQLPDGLQVRGWTPHNVPPRAGLQASGTIGAGAVWLRWYQGHMFLVVLPSAP